MTDYTKMIKTLRECANWFEAVAASSQYAHDELMALDYGDKLRDAADALEAAEQRIARLEEEHNKTVTAIFGEEQLWWENRCKELEAQMPKEGEWIPVTNGRGGHECSLCHGYAPTYQNGDEHLSDY